MLLERPKIRLQQTLACLQFFFETNLFSLYLLYTVDCRQRGIDKLQKEKTSLNCYILDNGFDVDYPAAIKPWS